MKIVEIYRRADKLWDWRLVDAGNNEIMATSGGQGFTERNDAEEGAQRVAEHMPSAVFGGEYRYVEEYRG